MKKIMFNDGLTTAVLEGRKTMTRRIAYTGEVVMPNSGYLTESKERGTCVLCDGNGIIAKSRYKVGEVVAIAQAYKDCVNEILINQGYKTDIAVMAYQRLAGWDNKMFVKAEVMPHQIRITNIHIERLQDISDDDCLKEGIENSYQLSHSKISDPLYFGFENGDEDYFTPRDAFHFLIDKVSGKGTWERNPWVFVYEFELIK